MSRLQGLSMVICVLFGFAYFGWIAWSEGMEFWLVASVVVVFAGLGFVVHRWMDAARGD